MKTSFGIVSSDLHFADSGTYPSANAHQLRKRRARTEQQFAVASGFLLGHQPIFGVYSSCSTATRQSVRCNGLPPLFPFEPPATNNASPNTYPDPPRKTDTLRADANICRGVCLSVNKAALFALLAAPPGPMRLLVLLLLFLLFSCVCVNAKCWPSHQAAIQQ